jgi:predicted RNase H-like HicB family nuclease
MQYTVLLHRRRPGGYVATAPAAPGCKAQGQTRDEALSRLKIVLENWLVRTEITTIEVSVAKPATDGKQNPWLATAGIFANDSTLEPMLHEIYAARAAERLVE